MSKRKKTATVTLLSDALREHGEKSAEWLRRYREKDPEDFERQWNKCVEEMRRGLLGDKN